MCCNSKDRNTQFKRTLIQAHLDTYVTSTVLLDSRLTFRALFSVRLYPICRFRVVRTFLQPLLHDKAQTRRMIVPSSASKAELISTCAKDGRNDCI